MKNVYQLFLFLIVLSSCNLMNNPLDNPTNTGNDAEVVWNSDLAAEINPATGRYMPAVDEQGNIYIIMEDESMNGYVIQSFSKDGDELWTKYDNTESLHHLLISYYKNKLFFATDNKMICLNSADGSLRWEYNEPDSLAFFISKSWAIVNDQIVTTLSYGTADGSYLFSFDTGSGQLAWTQKISDDNRVVGFVCASGNQLFFVNDKVIKYSVTNNGANKNWESEIPGNSEYSFIVNTATFPAVDSDGNIIFTIRNYEDYESVYTVVCYDNGGSLKWQYTPDNTGKVIQPNCLMTDADNDVYLPQNELVKLDKQNGTLLWEADAPDETLGFGSINHITIGEDEKLYVGDSFGYYILNQSGEITLNNALPEWNGNNPLTYATLLPNGNVIMLAMGSSDSEVSQIYCIKSESGGVERNAWAKWGANAANTFNSED